MIQLVNIFGILNTLLESEPFLLSVFVVAATLKLFILLHLIVKRSYISSTQLSYLFLIGILISTLVQDLDWVLWLTKKLFFNDIELRFFIFSRRLAWASTILLYQFLTLFLESLLVANFKLQIRHKLFSVISGAFTIFFIGIAFIDYDCLHTADKPLIEIALQKFVTMYLCFPLILSSFLVIFLKRNNNEIPRIIKKQIRILMSYVIFPFWISDLIQVSPFIFSFSFQWLNTSYAFVSLSNIMLTGAIFYCSRKMLGLRFLNFNTHVISPVNVHFMENFKTILDQFSQITNLQELNHIMQGFFKEAFSIPINRAYLYLRNHQGNISHIYGDREQTYMLVETFMSTHSDAMCLFIKKQKILIYDELAFSNFYESTSNRTEALNFLNAIQADIFLPVYEKEVLVGYIIVDRLARLNEFYSNSDYDEMLIFVNYLANIINLMKHKNLDHLIHQEKMLQEELYSKHQEINQYKESIRSFLRTNKQKDIGIIFYKNRRFTFGNQAAKELVKINPNLQEGHPISKTLKELAQKVELYKTPQTAFAKDSDGIKIVLAAVPSLDKNNVIISIYYPEVSDVIKKQIDMLKDPTEWDYLLYLETTKPGQLISQLIPGSGETLLNFKIELLKTALSKKATLLDSPEEDLMPLVELLHHISLRETLHIIDLTSKSTSLDIAIKLFGINNLFGVKNEQAVPLLQQLDTVGTLFIKNVDFLDIETQKYLAEFIRYGFFKVFKSDQKISSNVRIICSSTRNLSLLVKEGTFLKELCNELKHTTLHMPSLITLPEDELAMLAEGFSEQAIVNKTYQNILTLSDKDKTKIAHQRPASLQELKERVQHILVQKSKKNDIYHEMQFDPAYDISDPELVEAARLGKQALKDPRIFTMLWNKFKNQNKIAAFLGVNRSSVNRRCKQFTLQ